MRSSYESDVCVYSDFIDVYILIGFFSFIYLFECVLRVVCFLFSLVRRNKITYRVVACVQRECILQSARKRVAEYNVMK